MALGTRTSEQSGTTSSILLFPQCFLALTRITAFEDEFGHKLCLRKVRATQIFIPRACWEDRCCREPKSITLTALNIYLPRILAQVKVLGDVVAHYGNTPILLNDVMMWFSFDSMGEFAFNQSFDMMKTGTWHTLIRQQRAALSILGPMNPMVWGIRLGFAFGGFLPPVKSWKNMIGFCEPCIKQRLTVSTET